jgi:hypothetical protein
VTELLLLLLWFCTVTLPGYGYSAGPPISASQCAIGTFNAGGNQLACQACTNGLTTQAAGSSSCSELPACGQAVCLLFTAVTHFKICQVWLRKLSVLALAPVKSSWLAHTALHMILQPQHISAQPAVTLRLLRQPSDTASTVCSVWAVH